MLNLDKAQLKVALYLKLLDTPDENLSEADVDLMYCLAKDEDIQQSLDQTKRDLSSAG